MRNKHPCRRKALQRGGGPRTSAAEREGERSGTVRLSSTSVVLSLIFLSLFLPRSAVCPSFSLPARLFEVLDVIGFPYCKTVDLKLRSAGAARRGSDSQSCSEK